MRSAAFTPWLGSLDLTLKVAFTAACLTTGAPGWGPWPEAGWGFFCAHLRAGIYFRSPSAQWWGGLLLSPLIFGFKNLSIGRGEGRVGPPPHGPDRLS